MNKKKRKAILLAGGNGTRLYPTTLTISKHLLPIYDKPMIYYPLSVIMLAGIKEILIISTERDIPTLKNLLGSGSKWGLSLNYKVQPKPEGIAQALLLGESFLDNSPSLLILGDNVFYGEGFANKLIKNINHEKGAFIFPYYVKNPQRYGVVEFDS